MIRVRVLGPVTVSGNDGAERPVERPAVRALLAILVTKLGRVVPIDELVASLWPEEQPDNPIDALHSRLRRLRQVLNGAGLMGKLTREPSGYRLALTDEQVDVAVFENLIRRAGESESPAPPLAHLEGCALR